VHHITLQQCITLYYNSASHYITTVHKITLQQCITLHYNSASHNFITVHNIKLQQCITLHYNSASHYITAVHHITLPQHTYIHHCIQTIMRCASNYKSKTLYISTYMSKLYPISHWEFNIPVSSSVLDSGPCHSLWLDICCPL